MSISDAELTQYWAIIDEINRYAQADFVALWRQLEREDKETLFRGLRDGVPEIVELYRNAQADAAMVFYESTQGVAYDRAAAVAAGAVNEEQVEAALRYAVFARVCRRRWGLRLARCRSWCLMVGVSMRRRCLGRRGGFVLPARMRVRSARCLLRGLRRIGGRTRRRMLQCTSGGGSRRVKARPRTSTTGTAGASR